MKVLRVRPKHYPEVIDIDCSLESLQKEVEGPIQAIYPWDDEVALICNEEGKLYDDCMEKLNRTLDGPYGIPIDIIVGTFLIVGLTEDDFGELLPEFIEKYEKMFHQPRKFVTYTDSEGKAHLDVGYCIAGCIWCSTMPVLKAGTASKRTPLYFTARTTHIRSWSKPRGVSTD